jgi:hypothetical protein
VPAGRIVAADLTDWEYRPAEGVVAVDPKLGLLALAREPRNVWVSYHYGFPGDIGAHESPRPLSQPREAVLYRVGAGEPFGTIGAALDRWRGEKPPHAVIEVADSGFYAEPVDVEVPPHHSLQLRAANRCRPVLHLLDYHPARGEALSVLLHDRARFTLCGFLVVGRPLRVEGAGERAVDARVVVRRCTLVPGWAIGHDCDPAQPGRSSLDVRNLRGGVTVERSILGALAVMDETTESDPLPVTLSDSIVDAATPGGEAVVGPGASYAWASLRVLRCTVFGRTEVHAIELGENSIFDGTVRVVRRQAGCLRFCWVPPGSRTPRRYHCQPDLVDAAAREAARAASEDPLPRVAEERRRVEPRFTSRRFGTPAYARLDFDCADEITRGADDESEMGAYHDLLLPHRLASLRGRLLQATPAAMETGIIHAD